MLKFMAVLRSLKRTCLATHRAPTPTGGLDLIALTPLMPLILSWRDPVPTQAPLYPCSTSLQRVATTATQFAPKRMPRTNAARYASKRQAPLSPHAAARAAPNLAITPTREP